MKIVTFKMKETLFQWKQLNLKINITGREIHTAYLIENNTLPSRSLHILIIVSVGLRSFVFALIVLTVYFSRLVFDDRFQCVRGKCITKLSWYLCIWYTIYAIKNAIAHYSYITPLYYFVQFIAFLFFHNA